MPFVDRDSFIALLEQLRSQDEAEVVAAAREVTRRMDEGNVAWGDLLVAPDGGTPSDEDEFFDDDDDDLPDEDEVAGEAEAAPDAERAGEAEEEEEDDDTVAPGAVGGDKALIDKLLARQGLAETTREELELLKRDIAEGEFTAADSKYLKALAARLDGAAKTKPAGGRRKR